MIGRALPDSPRGVNVYHVKAAPVSALRTEELPGSAQQELLKHYWDTFVEDPPTVAQGGCPPCRKRFNTANQFMRHLAEDVLPQIVARIAPISAS